MLIPNITTEFKDSNGKLRVVWDMVYYPTGSLGNPDKRSVNKVHKVEWDFFSTMNCVDATEVYNNIWVMNELKKRLLKWASPQTIEQLKAKLAF